MISFVFYFSNKRIENLKQTIRFLNKNENLKIHEIILVCNEICNEELNAPNSKIFNINLHTYNKPLLCNFGVDKAKHDIVALLDSDRILPYKYFEKTSCNLRKKQFSSSLILYKLLEDYNDEEIDLKKYEYKEEIKSKKCEFFHKNLFSGNTLFYKKDYFDCGGMDESFEGYGFADNDMTYNIMSKGYSICWNREIEIHLNHPVEFLYKGKILENDEFKKISKGNLEKFKNKWIGHNIKNFIKF
jgi:hypothetical protein